MNLAGLWKWPQDVRTGRVSRQSELSAEAVEEIRQRMAQGTPWFVDPERFDEAIEKRDRKYARRLKVLYWSKEK